MTRRARITHDTEITTGTKVGPVTRIVAPPGSTPGHVPTVDADGETLVLAAIPEPEVLDDLTDVDAPSPEDGDVLTYSGSAGAWIAAEGGGGGLDPLDPDPSGSYTNPILTVDQYGRVTTIQSTRPSVTIPWEGTATDGDSEGLRVIGMDTAWTPQAVKVRSLKADGTLEDCDATFSISALSADGLTTTDLVGSGTAPALSSDSLYAADPLDWTGGAVPAGGALVVQPLTHTPGDSVLLVLDIFGVRS